MAACPPGRPDSYYLKCRISQAVTPQALLEEFEVFDLLKLHFPKPDHCGRMGQAFLEFSSSASRRRAHTKNENYIHDCQLQLHYSSQHSLREAVVQNNFSTYEMSSYKMQRQVALGIEQVFIASSSGGIGRKDAPWNEASSNVQRSLGFVHLSKALLSSERVALVEQPPKTTKEKAPQPPGWTESEAVFQRKIESNGLWCSCMHTNSPTYGDMSHHASGSWSDTE